MSNKTISIIDNPVLDEELLKKLIQTLGPFSDGLSDMRPFGKLLDNLAAKFRQIVWFATGDQSLLAHNRLVDPLGTSSRTRWRG